MIFNDYRHIQIINYIRKLTNDNRTQESGNDKKKIPKGNEE